MRPAWGASTIASTSRASRVRSSPATVRHATTRGPLRGRVRRRASAPARLSSSAATAATASGRVGRRPRPALPGRDQRAHHLSRALEYAARVVVGERLQGPVERLPAEGGDPFLHLGRRLPVGGFEEKEVAVLVDVAAAKAEVPVDAPDGSPERQLGQARLL